MISKDIYFFLPTIIIYFLILLPDSENVLLQDTLDNITLYSIITIMSFLLTVPVTLFVEGIKFTPSYLQTTVSIMCTKNICIQFTFFFIFIDSRQFFICSCFVYFVGFEPKRNLCQMFPCWTLFSCLSAGEMLFLISF